MVKAVVVCFLPILVMAWVFYRGGYREGYLKGWERGMENKRRKTRTE